MTPNAEQAVYKTLAYYKALSELPLTTLEIQRYLIQKEGEKTIPLFDIYRALDALKHKNTVVEYSGLWTLQGYDRAIQKRLMRLQWTPVKWKMIRKRLWFLPLIPFVKKVTITGSVALAHATKESDVDVLLHAQKGTVWTVRFLATIIAWILGVRRHGVHIKNRLCFNHFSLEGEPSLGPGTIHAVVSRIGVVLWRDKRTQNYESLFTPSVPSFLLSAKRAIEVLVQKTKIQPKLENWLGNGQIQKIYNNPLGYPSELEMLSLATKNLIFYYPKVRETEERYKTIITNES